MKQATTLALATVLLLAAAAALSWQPDYYLSDRDAMTPGSYNRGARSLQRDYDNDGAPTTSTHTTITGTAIRRSAITTMTGYRT